VCVCVCVCTVFTNFSICNQVHNKISYSHLSPPITNVNDTSINFCDKNLLVFAVFLTGAGFGGGEGGFG